VFIAKLFLIKNLEMIFTGIQITEKNLQKLRKYKPRTFTIYEEFIPELLIETWM
jgi:hypothetical protein